MNRNRRPPLRPRLFDVAMTTEESAHISDGRAGSTRTIRYSLQHHMAALCRSLLYVIAHQGESIFLLQYIAQDIALPVFSLPCHIWVLGIQSKPTCCQQHVIPGCKNVHETQHRGNRHNDVSFRFSIMDAWLQHSDTPLTRSRSSSSPQGRVQPRQAPVAASSCHAHRGSRGSRLPKAQHSQSI